MGLLSLAIWTPIVFGAVLLALGRDDQARAVRWLALVGSVVSFLVTLPLYGRFDQTTSAMQFVEKQPWIDRFIDVHYQTWYKNGGEPQVGRQLRALFNAAGVVDLQITASVWCYATPEETTAWGHSYADRLLTSPMGERPVEYGFATRAEIESMASAFRAWSAHPDAMWMFIHIEALGQKD